MATDIDAVISNINSFYAMRDKSIIHVGAGGGQLIGYAVNARSVIGVDPDPVAVTHLEEAIQRLGLKDRFNVVHGEFSSISSQADVVFFEFCLHEMDDPAEALHHAQSLAPEIVVVDHSPESRWAWYTCEEEKAARSWAAVRRLDILREASFKTTQQFKTYSELLSRVQVLGEESVARIEEFKGRDNIEFGMEYAMALVRRDAD